MTMHTPESRKKLSIAMKQSHKRRKLEKEAAAKSGVLNVKGNGASKPAVVKKLTPAQQRTAAARAARAAKRVAAGAGTPATTIAPMLPANLLKLPRLRAAAPKPPPKAAAAPPPRDVLGRELALEIARLFNKLI